MADQDSGAKQTATGVGIAQAAEGGTASVSIGFTADDVKQILSAALAQQSTSIPPGASVVLEAPPLNMEPPLRPEPALGRRNLEARVKESLSKGRSVVLCGDFGSGRTELARNVSEKYDRTHWLDIQANPHLQPHLALELFLQMISTSQNARTQKSEEQRKPTNTPLLVIDNVEAAVLQPEFEARIRGLASPNNDRPPIILISLHPLPNPLSALFDSVEVERFDSAEVAALVKLYGAPQKIFTAELLNLVIGVTHGMPYLLSLLLKHWISKNWATDDDSWLELLRSDFATDLRAETQRRLLAMQEPSSCELLYRLTLLLGPFSEKEVIQIAAVKPAIDRAGERLQGLSGVWLPRVNNRQWRTSPLIRGAGEANLIRTTQHAVHSAAANWIFAKRTLNQTDTSEVILHLLQAERFNDAAEVYIRALHALLEADVDAYPGTLLSLWKGLPIPEQINLGPRILIRGLQVANALRRFEDYLPALEDLKQLIVQATGARDRVSVYGASALVAMRLVQTETRAALPFISMAVQEERFLPEEADGFLNSHSAAEMFWVAAMRAKSPSDIREWTTEVSKLTDDDRAALMEVEFAAASASKMFDSLWWREQDKPDDERNWTPLLECLKECEFITGRWQTPLISACILRSELSIRIVHLRDIEAGCKDAERFYAENQDHALAIFILADGTASWLLDVDRWDLASTWLTRAYQYAGLKIPLHQQLNCLRYGHLLRREGAPSRVPFERALAIGNESDGLTLFNQLKAKAEFATFLWKTGEVNELYSTWSDVVRGVLEHRDDNSVWKHFFMLAMNNTTFFWSEAARSKVNEGMVSTPVPCMFIGGYQSLADRYRPELVFMMPGGMAQWADHLGKLSEAAEWVKLTETIGREASKNDLAMMYQMHAIPFDLKEGRFVDTFTHASQASRGLLCQVPPAVSPEREKEPTLDGSREQTIRPTYFARFVPLHLGVFPSLLAIGIDAERHPEMVRESIESLIGDMQTKRKNDPEVWDIGIHVFQEVLQGQLRWTDLRNTTPEENDHAGLVTHLLRSFGLWITANDSPRDLLIAQGNMASYLAAYFPQMGSIGTIICISIARMWVAKIESCPFYFRQPRDTASRIRELADDALLGELIVVLADSVGVGFQNTTRDIFKTYILRK